MTLLAAESFTRSGLQVFSTCPDSELSAGPDYLDDVVATSIWSERNGCSGMLVYSDNRLVDPWVLAHLITERTDALRPLVAVQPAYMHPYTAANMIATLAHLYGRRLFVNWVAGGFRNDLLALADGTPHDKRYERLVEYATIVRRLTDGETVTFDGEFYRVSRLRLTPEVDPGLRPEFMVSGSSEAGRAAARVLGARSVAYALPPDELVELPAGPGLSSGLRIGIIARADRDTAWQVAHTRFPPDRKGKLTRELARRVSDSQWHERLCRLAEERAQNGDPYWLVPFENYKTMCPYLVGTHEEVAAEIARYLEIGFGTFILDIPWSEEDLVEARVVFEMALAKKSLVAAPVAS